MTKTNELLRSFLPLELLAKIYGSSGKRPAAVEFPAAVMFVDVSRYTALVEQLAQRGQDGLEKIPTLLSRSYARCADQICDRGGEVLYFAGDSLLAYWAADKNGLEVRPDPRRCAETICRDRNDLSGGSTERSRPGSARRCGCRPSLGGRLGWPAGVESGRRRRCRYSSGKVAGACAPLGYVLSDSALQALGEGGRRHQPPARLKVSQEVLHPQWLTGFLPPQLRDVGYAPTPTPSNDEFAIDFDGVAGWTPPGCAGRDQTYFCAFRAHRGTEQRGPLALSRHQTLCVSLQQILRWCGGPPGELLLDDKGLVFMVAFGARGTFHRDDPHRAIDAARAIDLTIRRLGLSASVGVATGDALFRVVGSERRRQLMVLGVVNRAARLMTAISGGCSLRRADGAR